MSLLQKHTKYVAVFCNGIEIVAPIFAVVRWENLMWDSHLGHNCHINSHRSFYYAGYVDREALALTLQKRNGGGE